MSYCGRWQGGRMAEAENIRARGNAAAAAGDQAAAAKAFVDLARLGAADKGVQSEAIEALFRLEDYGSAHEVAAAALARFPASPAMALAAVRALLALERKAEASDVLKGLC